MRETFPFWHEKRRFAYLCAALALRLRSSHNAFCSGMNTACS
jgi:hypothetical protein